MILRRELEPVRLDQRRVRRSVVVMGDECPPGSPAMAMQKHEILRLLADGGKHLLQCGGSEWQEITSVRHDGTRWVAQAFAVVEEPNEEEE